MIIHFHKCKGVTNILQCEYCEKILASRSSKCTHLKTCKAKKESDAKALTVANPTSTNNNFQTQNNIGNQTVNIRHHTLANHSDILRNYTKVLLSRQANPSVRQDSVLSAYCKAHIGDNKW